MPKRYKHLFEQVVSLENLFAAARKAMRGKRGKAPAAACFADLERVVVDLRDELVSGSWRPGQYVYFMITDPKEREVAAAPFRDRIVHHALVRVLEPLGKKKGSNAHYKDLGKKRGQTHIIKICHTVPNTA